MKLSNEFWWQFESMGKPDANEQGSGAGRDFMMAQAKWLTKTPLYRRIKITIARTQEELADRRMTQLNESEADADFQQMLAVALAEAGGEIE